MKVVVMNGRTGTHGIDSYLTKATFILFLSLYVVVNFKIMPMLYKVMTYLCPLNLRVSLLEGLLVVSH